MTPIKAGDTVICIDAMPPPGLVWPPTHSKGRLYAGHSYIVGDVSDRCIGLLEFPFPLSDRMGFCGRCRVPGYFAYWHWEKWRFIKLDGELETERAENEVTA